MIGVRKLLAIMIALSAQTAHAADRVAIIVGNANYQHGPLLNPMHDARTVASMFDELGFETVLLADLDRKGMHGDLIRSIALSKDADIAVFYYAGHGLQSEGINYLLPVDADISNATDVADQGLSMPELITMINEAGVKTGLVFLDACRDNPLVEAGLVEPGLAFVEQSGNELVVSYAAAAGAVAYDGTGQNSPYSQALVEALRQPGLDVYSVMRHLRKRVRQMTEGRQIPWVTGSVERPIVLNRESDFTYGEQALFDQRDPDWLDDSFWATIVGRGDPQLFQAFLDSFPASRYAKLARERLAEMAVGKLELSSSLVYQEPASSPAKDAALVEPLASGITHCDVLAASDRDPLRLTMGVPFNLINADQAIMACTADLKQQPNEPRLMAQLARALNQAERFPEALHYYQLAAERGYPEGYSGLGGMFALGWGVKADADQAIGLWRRGIELGSPNAKANLGRSYRDGFGVPVSIPDALHWFRLAALTGEKIAADDLGNMFYKGELVPRNVERALDWFALGASLGSSNAMTNIGNIHRNSGKEDLAAYWYERASAAGNRFAPFHLGRMLINAESQANATEALELYLLAGNRGFAEGFTQAARLYAAGLLDDEGGKGYFLAQLALRSGHEPAAELLAEFGKTLDQTARDTLDKRVEIWLLQNGDTLRIARFAK